ncbi:MAG: hypothetical protein QMD92_07520, partial [bacterium]|nr:hypothetical protein [bacterium]
SSKLNLTYSTFHLILTVTVFPYFLKHLEALFIAITFISALFIIFFVIKLFEKFNLSKQNLHIFMALWILSPIWWLITIYAHPIIPAFAALLAGTFFLKDAHSNISEKRYLIYFGLSFLFFFISFSFRGEVLLFVPAVFLLCVEFKNKKRLILSLFSIFLSIALFFVLQNYLLSLDSFLTGLDKDSPAQVTNKTFSSTFSLTKDFFYTFSSIQDIKKGIIAIIFTFGMLSSLILPAGIYYILKKKYYKYLIVTLVFIGPSLLLWLPIPTPSRHFILVVFGLAFLSSFAFSFLKRRLAVFLLVVTIMGNILLPELLYNLILKHYTFQYPKLKQIAGRIPAQIPLGCLVLDYTAHIKIRQYTEKEYDYLKKLNKKNIVFIGYNNDMLMTYFIQDSKKVDGIWIGGGVRKFICDNKSIIFVWTDYFSKNNFFEEVIKKIGKEYNKGFYWYINPPMQNTKVPLDNIPSELKLIKPFFYQDAL